MAKTDDVGVPIDDETKQILEDQVNKGKARKFILIYRGATIKKLIVFRKGPFQSRIQKAKKDGFKGEAVCGIVRGSGRNISFQLAGSAAVAGAMDVDGVVEKDPTKVEKLKQFLKENDLARKPEYKILRDVTEVAAAMEGAGPGASKSASVAEPELAKSASGGTGSSEAPEKAKAERLKKAVLPKVKTAVANDPSKSELIKELLKTVAEAEKASSFGDMLRGLERLAITVKETVAGGGEKTDYDQELPGAEQQVRTLKSHKQHAAIAAEIRELDGFLESAKQNASQNEYQLALEELEKVEAGFEPALDLADLAELYRDAEAKMVKKYGELKPHQGFGGIDAEEVTELEQKFADADAKIVARDFDAAKQLLRDIKAKLKAYRKQAHKHGDYVGLRNNALLLIDALRIHPNADAITAKINKLQTDYVDRAANEYDSNSNYPRAKAILERVQGKYDSAKAVADSKAKASYDKLSQAVKAKIEQLDVEENQSLIAEEITAIKSRFEKAGKYAATNQFADAELLLNEIDQKCDAAAAEASRQREFAAAETVAADAANEMQDKPQAAVDAVQKLHDQLKAHPQHAVVGEDLAGAQTKIDSAASMITA